MRGSLKKKFNFLAKAGTFAAKVGASAAAGVAIKAGVASCAAAVGVSAVYGIGIAAAGAALTNGVITTVQFARQKDKKLWSKEHGKALLGGMTSSALVGGALSYLVPGLGHLFEEACNSEIASSVKDFVANNLFSGSAPVDVDLGVDFDLGVSEADAADIPSGADDFTTEPQVHFDDWGNLGINELGDAVEQFIPDNPSPELQDILNRMESSNLATKAQAIKDFGHGLYNGEYGLPLNNDAAFAVNHVAVELSGEQNAQAVFNEAYSYLHGKGTEIDHVKAEEGFKKALALGYDRACGFLEYMRDMAFIDDVPPECSMDPDLVETPEPTPDPIVEKPEPEISQPFTGAADPPPTDDGNAAGRERCFYNDRLNNLWWNTAPEPDGCPRDYALKYGLL